MKAKRLERKQRQNQKHERETSGPCEREPEREANIWDALNDIGRESPSQHKQTASVAMQRIQERTTEQQNVSPIY